MLLTCPQCETIFRVDRLRLHPAGQPVHCMICDHIWTARLVTSGDRQDMPSFASYLHKFRLPVIAVLICAGLMTSLIKGRGILTAYFPGSLPPISKARFLYSLILTQVPRPKSALFRFHGLFLTRDQFFAAAVKSGIDSSLIISAMGLAPRNRCALPSRTITSAAGDRLL